MVRIIREEKRETCLFDFGSEGYYEDFSCRRCRIYWTHTVYELIDNGADVVIIDSLETGHIEAVHPKARFYQGDIRDRAFLDDVLTKEKNIDGVIHFAANSLVGESMNKSFEIL